MPQITSICKINVDKIHRSCSDSLLKNNPDSHYVCDKINKVEIL